jgi:hypothetical protein
VEIRQGGFSERKLEYGRAKSTSSVEIWGVLHGAEEVVVVMMVVLVGYGFGTPGRSSRSPLWGRISTKTRAVDGG